MPKRGDIFQSIPVGRIGRTNFNLSHQLTGNFKEAICYPVFCEETQPGSIYRIKVWNISKLETLIAPAMQRTNASLLWFKMPKRLCMRNFKKWYTGGIDGNASVEKPYILLKSIQDWWVQNISEQFDEDEKNLIFDYFFGPGSLWQMVGLPLPVQFNQNGTYLRIFPDDWTSAVTSQMIDLIPFIAYQRIYDEYFRDQTLSESVFVSEEDYPIFNINREIKIEGTDLVLHSSGINVFDGGEFEFADIITLFALFRRAWQKDYYTSAQPTPQRGPEVTLDMFQGKDIPVEIPEGQIILSGVGDTNQIRVQSGISIDYPEATSGDVVVGPSNSQGWSSLNLDYEGDIGHVNQIRATRDALSGTADISGLSPITISAFRNLFKLQAFLEKNNVAGGRFIEYILAHWAERIPDFTVQRPVFVRATSIPVVVSEVTATANSEGVNSQLGDQAGRAKGQGNLGNVNIYTQEPSIIIGIYVVTPPPSYVTQGIPKKFQRMTRWDEPFPEFQHIGEQAIKQKELYLDWSGNTDPEDEFGYQQRYSELKYLPDRVVGDFATNLAYWNQARIFTSVPRLNQTFIEANPSDRIFAVQNQKPVLADFWFDIECSMKLSKFSTPKLN